VVGRIGQVAYTKVVASLNTGEIKATGQAAGGVAGYMHSVTASAGSMIACYSVGKVAEGTSSGAVCGHTQGIIKTSFYGGDNAPALGIGFEDNAKGHLSVSVNQFSASAWPATTMDGWTTGTGGYWQSLGSAPNTWPTLP
jgi:hypothetical protein